MRRLTWTRRTFFIASIGSALAYGAVAATARPPGGRPGCECAPIDLPVLCSDGRVYLNPCVASCAGATGCVPYGDPGIP